MREIENAMERGVALARSGQIDVDDLPEELRHKPLRLAQPFTGHSTRTLAEVERAHILEVLELNGGNQTRTARALEIGNATLYRRLLSYGFLSSPGKAIPVASVTPVAHSAEVVMDVGIERAGVDPSTLTG